MTHSTCQVGPITLGAGQKLALIAGPCVLEASDVNDQIARTLRDICAARDVPFIFKASFDKANRTSIRSSRGPGTEYGLAELARIRTTFDVPVTTDIHEPEQASLAAEVADLLQVPAFLCRQTDLLMACAATGKPVNVKKGQFMAPAEMRHVITKLREGGCRNMMLTERGTFFGYHRLVNDFIGLGDLMDLGAPVCFDVTHSTQLPGAAESSTAGRPDRAFLLGRAATAAGVHALFVECHPDPAKALSDAATMQPLGAMDDFVQQALAVREAITRAPSEVARRLV